MIVHLITNGRRTMNAAAAAGTVRRVELHRRVAVIGPDRIDIRPSRRALLPPLAAFLVGVAFFAGIVFGLKTLPMLLLVLMLLVAIVTIPFAGLSVVYAIIGAHVVVDRAKQSATWQQGLIGLGIGTQELVPFWKIGAIAVEEAGAAPEGTGSPIEEFAQWQIVLEKTSGKRLVVAGVTAARPFADDALARAADVAGALAALTGAPLRLPEIASEEPEPAPAPRPARRRPVRRAHRRARHR